MKWIWLLLFLAIIGEIMDTMEFADAAKKKKKKISRKKKKGKGKKKPTRRTTTTRRPGSGNGAMSDFDASLMFYSPMPPFGPHKGNGPIEPLTNTGDTFSGDLIIGTNSNIPPVEVVITQPGAFITGQKDSQKNGWFRQRRGIDENAIVLEYLGFIDKGKSNEFGLERSKRNIRMLKIAGSKGAGDNMDSNSTEDITANPEETRRKRSTDIEDKRKELQAKRQESLEKIKGKTDEIKNQLRPKRNAEKLKEQSDKVQKLKDKSRNNRDENKEQLSKRPKRDLNTPESLKENIKKQQQENRQRMQDGKNNNINRSKRESHKQDIDNKIKNKQRELQAKREEVKDKLGRPKRETKRDEINHNTKNKQVEATNKIQAKKEEINGRQKRDIKSQVEKAKENIETRRQKQQEKKEKQEAKRRRKLNGSRNQTNAADHLLPSPVNQAEPNHQAQVMRMKRSIDAEELPKLQTFNSDNDDYSSYSEEYYGEDCLSDENYSGPDYLDDSDEVLNPASDNTEEIRSKRDWMNDKIPPPENYSSQHKLTLPKQGFETVARPKRQSELPGAVPGGPEVIECIGDDCSSEECVGDDCTYEDSDSDESEEVPKVVAKRQVEDNLSFRQISGPRKTGFGSVKQTGLAAGCGSDGGDYGGTGTDDYGATDYEEEQRRKRRRRKNRRNRNKNNRKNNRRNRPALRRQSSASFNESHIRPFNVAAATPLPTFDLMTKPSNNVFHPLGKRQIQRDNRIVTTTMSSRISYTRPPTNLERPKRDSQGLVDSPTPIPLNNMNDSLQGLIDDLQISPGVTKNHEPNKILAMIPNKLQTSAKVKRQAQKSLDVKSDKQPTKPNSNKEGSRGKVPPTERRGIWSKNIERSKREVPNNRPKKQPREEENNQGRRPPIDRPELQVKKPDRQRRDIGTLIMHSSVPKLPDDYLTKLPQIPNLSEDILPIIKPIPIISEFLPSNPEIIPIIVKREAVNRPEKQPKGPRSNRDGTQGRRPPSDEPELLNKRPDVNRSKRDLPPPMLAVSLPLLPEETQGLPKMTFNIPEGNTEGLINGMLHTDMKYKRDVQERRERNEQMEKIGEPRRPQSLGNRNGQDRPKRSADLNSVANPDGSQTRILLPLDDIQSGDVIKVPLGKVDTILGGTFDLKQPMEIKVKRAANEQRQPNQQRRTSDGNRRNDKIDQDLGQGDRPNRPNGPNIKRPSERLERPNENERQKRSPSLNPGNDPDILQYRMPRSATDPLSIPHENEKIDIPASAQVIYTLPAPTFARAGSVLAGAMNILLESSTVSEVPPEKRYSSVN